MIPPMRSKLILTVVVLLVFAGSFLAKGRLRGRHGRPRSAPASYERIVSMAPSITETLFALGLGDRVVGVTRYCRVPPEAQARADVGGFFDPNFEALMALKPDVVITLESDTTETKLQELGLSSMVVSHKSVRKTLDSFLTIGKTFGAEAEGERLVSDIEARIRSVEEKTAGLDRPRVLFSVDRERGTGKLRRVTVAAADGYFDKIIGIAGGRNACPGTIARFPVVSSEGILWMKPEVIVDLVRSPSESNLDEATVLADWQQIPEAAAVRNGRVYVLDDDFASLPGPRFILLIEKLARLFHPDVDW